MTALSTDVCDRRSLWGAVLGVPAPAERLAAFRIALGIFTLSYLLIRLPVFVALGDRPIGDFEPVGLLAPLASPPAAWIVYAALALTIVGAAATAVG
ncbi:MAG: hypothetical protein R2705_09855 [Ilumatobacteraceae bacterium]